LHASFSDISTACLPKANGKHHHHDLACLQLPDQTTKLQHVCVGDEWYRFPSSFWLPGPRYRLQFVKSGFSGLLPRPFSPNEVHCFVEEV